MTIQRQTRRAGILLSIALLALPPWVTAAPAAGDKAAGNCESGFHGGPPSHPPGPPMGPGGPSFGPGGGDHDEARLPPFLMGLKLSEDLQDKIFSITHAAAPALRDQSKALHKARGALMELVSAPDFSDANAVTLSQSQANAESQLTLLHARMEHQIYLVLTPAQQSQVGKRKQDWESHHGDWPPPGA